MHVCFTRLHSLIPSLPSCRRDDWLHTLLTYCLFGFPPDGSVLERRLAKQLVSLRGRGSPLAIDDAFSIIRARRPVWDTSLRSGVGDAVFECVRAHGSRVRLSESTPAKFRNAVERVLHAASAVDGIAAVTAVLELFAEFPLDVVVLPRGLGKHPVRACRPLHSAHHHQPARPGLSPFAARRATTTFRLSPEPSSPAVWFSPPDLTSITYRNRVVEVVGSLPPNEEPTVGPSWWAVARLPVRALPFFALISQAAFAFRATISASSDYPCHRCFWCCRCSCCG